ncbi:MAG TPA: LLM class flavin-dependent oxidoreductase [Acidimicrobiales bacterium]|nr:LLM class flavin-dependent oxidoreductase [Acidimicrobiales bacterium]
MPLPTLSVLDLAPVVLGSTPSEALANSLDLVRHVEHFGYHRYWVAEHHNMPGIASSSPPVLIAHLAAGTSRIRLGSGGVMLPNHAPLVVAEQFGMLEALHPGRIDLGIGRAPGTDPVTAHALRRNAEGISADEFPRQLGELLAFFNGTFPETHPYHAITATPGLGYQPALWLLGSSAYSAEVAGLLGLPFSFAHHFSAENTMPALAHYRASFRPSDTLAEPCASIGVSVIVGEDDAHAHWLAGPSRLSFVRRRTGRPARLSSPEEAAEYHFTPMESELLRSWSSTSVVGGPDTVRRELEALAARTGVQELLVLTSVHGHKDRMRSYELLAQAAELDGAPQPEGVESA